jgi:hypothetical protein
MIKIIPNAYTPKECNDLIKYSEKIGYSDILVNKFNESFKDTEFRNDLGVAVSDSGISKQLLAKIKNEIQESGVKINPLLRFSKYEKGSGVVDHIDSILEQGNYKSKYTVILYLNDAKGGETEFEGMKIDCVQGTLLIFDQTLQHKANKAKTVKYTLRTDILVPTKEKKTTVKKVSTRLRKLNIKRTSGRRD